MAKKEPSIIGMGSPTHPDVSLPPAEKTLLDMVEEIEKAQGTEDPKLNFTFEEFEELYNSVMEVQTKVSRDVNGETIRSLPYDMEVELGEVIAWMKRKFKPYHDARLKFAENLGIVFDTHRGTYTLRPKPGKVDLTPAMKQEMAIENQGKFDKLAEAAKSMDELQFKHRDELFTEYLPLKLFTKNKIKESGILFKNIRNLQPFLQYCVVK